MTASFGGFIGALGSSRTGVHAELIQDDGRHLAVFRPGGGRHRVVDINSATDVSKEFATRGTAVSIFSSTPASTVACRARRRMRWAAPTSPPPATAPIWRWLAEQDQTKLWAAAEMMRATDDELQQVAESVGIGAGGRGGHRSHRAAPPEVGERCKERHDRFRHKSIVIALAGALKRDSDRVG